MQQRIEAEHDLARSAWGRVRDQHWWRDADQEQVEAYRAAAAWREVDPQAEEAAQRIETQAARSEANRQERIEQRETTDLLAAADVADNAQPGTDKFP